VIDEVESPVEAKPADRNRQQLFGRQLSFDAESGEECNPKASFHRILDACVAAEFERDI
jgi:hypothetical protein